MQAVPSNSAGRTDEIGLLDLLQALVRYKGLIALSVLVCVLAGAAYTFLKSPIYRATVNVRIGQVAGTGYFEEPDVLASRLLASYGEIVAEGVRRERPFLRRVTVARGVPGAVSLVSEADTPEEAVAFLEQVFAAIQKTHGEIYGRNVGFLQDRLDNLDQQLADLRKEQENLNVLFERLSKVDPVQASLLASQTGRVSAAIIQLESTRPGFAQALSPPQTLPSQMLGEVVAPTRPAAPKKLLVLVLSTAVGLMGGALLAFFLALAKPGHRDARRA